MTGNEDISWVRLVIAFTTVLVLLGGLGYILKYVSLRGLTLPGAIIRARRMQIVESLAIDTRRRFVIVRCDGREHLLLLGPQQDIVIEANLPTAPVTPTTFTQNP